MVALTCVLRVENRACSSTPCLHGLAQIQRTEENSRAVAPADGKASTVMVGVLLKD